MRKTILAIDAGTTGITVRALDTRGQITAGGYSEFRQIYPRPGWVEHDAREIWRVTARLLRSVVSKKREIAAIGITNQRETVVAWDPKTGRPLSNAIVWQCRRTAPECERLKAEGAEEEVRRRTGLVLDPYFSGTKVRWILDHLPGTRGKVARGRLIVGTVDTWLVWNLTRRHRTDPTNASRTMLYHIEKREWDSHLLQLIGVPRGVLPEVIPSTGLFGHVKELGGAPVHGVAGDQQAALYGQLCHTPGTLKNTYGTGAFLVANTGSTRPRTKRLLTTLACDAQGNPVYALEGSIFIAGAAIQWLRDELKILDRAADSERMARSIADTGGVYLVPAFVGLGAPYWDPSARGIITGVTRGTGRAELVRAALEAMAYQTRDVVDVIRKDTQRDVKELRVDGGAVANNWLLQFQADLLGTPVIRPKNIESTSLGAAFLAGVGAGIWSPSDLKKLVFVDRVFRPRRVSKKREDLYREWQGAVAASRLVSSFHTKALSGTSKKIV